MLGALTPRLRGLLSRAHIVALVLIALAPVVFVATRIVAASRNVVYWDEFETALQLLLKLDSGASADEMMRHLFELSNEHRMVTSRLMFAISYWLTGTVNFAVISALGNASLVVACGLLLYTAGTTVRRVRLAVILGLLLFQLEHYENFLWSGSSIDHFQVVLLAVAALCGVARGTRLSLLLGTLSSLLATFTLAHGLVTWVVGAAMLAHERRFKALGVWLAVAALAIGGFLTGFQLNTAQRFAEPSLSGALVVLRYWLELLGTVPALGQNTAAPFLGGALLLLLGWEWRRGAFARERVLFPVALYAVGALALIALGRAEEAGGLVHSRYLVLGAVAWGLVLFMLCDRLAPPARPALAFAVCLPLLLAFNLAANSQFAAKAESWLECRDRAAVRFKQHGVDGRGVFALHPSPVRSTALLHEAERRGVYRMPPICEERFFPEAEPSGRIQYYVEEAAVDNHSAAVVGWAAIAGEVSRRGALYLVLRSAREMHVFTTVTVTRPDVATAYNEPRWVRSGFRFARTRAHLPTGEYRVGFLVAQGGRAEYIMTDHRLNLVGSGKALLASAE